MKSSFIILFLSVILFQSVSGLFILGYYYSNRAFISENLCVNRFDAVPICKGKCFLNKKLKEKEQSDQKMPDLKKQVFQLYSQKIFDAQLTGVTTELNLFGFSSYNTALPLANADPVFHPPRLV